MLWTAPPRHESAIEMGAVRTPHDSEQPVQRDLSLDKSTKSNLTSLWSRRPTHVSFLMRRMDRGSEEHATRHFGGSRSGYLSA